MGPRVLKIAVGLFCFLMTGWLLSRSSAFTEQASEDLGSMAAIAAREGPVWSGIYYVDKKSGARVKVGYAKSETTKTERGYIIDGESRLTLKAQGQTAQMRVLSKILTDLDNRLLSIDFSMLSDAVKFELFGTVDGKQLKMRIRTAAGEQEQTIDIQGDTVLPETILTHAVRKGLNVGDVVKVPFFDPTTFSYADAELRVAEVTTLPEAGDAKVYHLRAKFMGIDADAWVDAEGRTLREEAGGLLTKIETQEQALTAGWSSGAKVETDLVEVAAVRTQTPVERPRDATKLVLKIGGVDLAKYAFADHRQTLAGDVVTIQTEDIQPSTYRMPMRDAAFEPDLNATPMIQVFDPGIKEKAREIVGEVRDPLQAARLIHTWVYKTIEKKPLISIPSARDVLDIKRGDCNEHATLYTALARAVGIPTRIEVGLVWNNNGFYYHAWNSVYTGQWISIDPTFGQFPADASHLKVLSGDLDAQVPIVQMVGSLTLDVLEEK